ncbi:hypothetical protein FJW10_23955 [Mesorhizobium sp. B4-1-1]|nr:hypothetical protein FJW10_23955 [Mesorhizobium sp. B4-1-1]
MSATWIAGITTKCKRAANAAVHFLDLRLSCRFHVGRDVLQQQRQTHQGRAQIVRDRGDHSGAILDIKFEPRLHIVERDHRCGDLRRPVDIGKRRHGGITPEALRCF